MVLLLLGEGGPKCRMRVDLLPSPAASRHPLPEGEGPRALSPDHQNCERAWYCRAAGAAASARRRWRGRSTLIAHRENVVCLAVKRNRSGTVHRLQILLNLESCWTFLLNDGQRAIAVSAECFHRCGIEHRAVGATGERQSAEDLTIVRTQNDHHRLRRLRRRVAGSGARCKKHAVLRI